MVEVCAICDIADCVHIRERERLRGFPGQAGVPVPTFNSDLIAILKQLRDETPAVTDPPPTQIDDRDRTIADLRAIIDAQAKLIAMMERAGK